MSDLEKDFIDREIQLPADTRILPPDVANDAAAFDAMKQAPSGEPPDDYTVRSVYDSRPVSGYDFNITDTQVMDAGSTGVQVLSFDVPSGYVAVLRHIRFFITQPPLITSDLDVLATIRVAGSDVRNNVGIPVGLAGDIECFVIADEFQTIGLPLTFNLTSLTSNMVAVFYGNFLLKTSVPAPFEIANRAGEGKLSPRGLTARLAPTDTPPQMIAASSSQDSRIRRYAPRFDKPPTPTEWASMPPDMQALYNSEMKRRAASK